MAENSWERTARESIARHDAEMRAADEAERAKNPVFWKLWDVYWLSRLVIFMIALGAGAVFLLIRWLEST